jgi:hypothetical protein
VVWKRRVAAGARHRSPSRRAPASDACNAIPGPGAPHTPPNPVVLRQELLDLEYGAGGGLNADVPGGIRDTVSKVGEYAYAVSGIWLLEQELPSVRPCSDD